MAFPTIVVFLVGTAIGSTLPELGNFLARYLGIPSHSFNIVFLAVGIIGIGMALRTGHRRCCRETAILVVDRKGIMGKRIAILVSGMPPERNGGTEIATMELAKHAAGAGHDVHVIVPSLILHGRESCSGITVHRLPTLPARYLYAVLPTPGIFALLCGLKPDVIHVQGMYSVLPALILSTLTRTSYIFSERGSIYINMPFKKTVYRIVLRSASRVIAQTEHQRQELSMYTSRNIEVIPNGIDTDRFNRTSKDTARSILGLPQNTNIVISVGRCRPEKNLTEFINLAQMDQREGNNFYVLVGDGPEFKQLKKQAAGLDNIRFAGSVRNSGIPVWMSAADVLVNTSLSEGFPVSLLEGMSCGVPIVAPRICGIPEILVDGVNGILTIPGDSQSATQAIDRILGDKQLASSMSETNMKKVGEYPWTNVVEKLYG